MKCLENYTIEQVKEMSFEELKLLWEKMVVEKQTADMRHTILDLLDVMEAEKPLIEN